jgi:prepilin-type N-terminal cleavage/methylation domain-containing protein
MKSKTRRDRGFTLIELSLVVAISLLVASALIGMFQTHIQMLNQAAKFRFLAQDAPFISLLLSRTIGNAEDYRIYTTGAIARTGSSGGTPGLTGSAVRLWMSQPNNTTYRQAVVSFESLNSQPAKLYFYLTDLTTGVFPTTPNWEMAGGDLTNVTFTATTVATNPQNPGILLAKLTGSNNDWYQFAAERK